MNGEQREPIDPEAQTTTRSAPEIDIEEYLRERFRENYELLRLTSGRSLSADIRRNALDQVLLYWRKMGYVAQTVTETEVRLALPQQTTPAGRKFTVEGVVDIVRDRDYTVMYDIKTHDADEVRRNPEFYRSQLNLYAHIWENVREERLDTAAVIATELPERVKQALKDGRPGHLDHALNLWTPLIEVDLDRESVQETIREFGETVDRIEQGEFAPPPVETLSGAYEGNNERFGNRICRNCDARFSCSSYHSYQQGRGGRAERGFHAFFLDEGLQYERDARRTAALESVPLAGENDPL